jgi:hypothetical protein
MKESKRRPAEYRRASSFALVRHGGEVRATKHAAIFISFSRLPDYTSQAGATLNPDVGICRGIILDHFAKGSSCLDVCCPADWCWPF